MPSITGIAHVELSVRDLDTSAAWYNKVLGMRRVWEGHDDTYGIDAYALLEPASGIVFALTQHRAGSREPFDATRPGLDHVSFAVADRDELRGWEQRLAELGVDYTPYAEWSHGAAVTVRDPDGIALVLYVRGAAPS
jgi:glyoxylase I family protein